jgi:hypothetical protein
VFQSVLHRGDFSNEAIQQTITREIEAALGTLYAVGETEEAARARLDSFIPSIQAWHSTFVHDAKKATPVRAHFIHSSSLYRFALFMAFVPTG